MKVTFISPYPDIMAFGIRTISAYLKANGHSTSIIILPDPYGDDLVYGEKRYSDEVVDALIPLCRDSDIIGITLMTNFFESAVQITEKLKTGLKTPVVWGGIHPTVKPLESLDYADIVCIGDGEDAMLELADRMEAGRPYHDLRNFWFKHKGRVIKNPPRPLIRDIDLYPRPDYSFEDHHILMDGEIKRFTYELMQVLLARGEIAQNLGKVAYQTMSGRGCPHKCTYCVNDSLKQMYNNQNYLRWRSTPHFMEELLWVKKNLPCTGFIIISDDAFFARPRLSIEEFCREYKKQIDLPFTCLASPMTISEEKMELLVDAGLVDIQMGVESGSRHVQKLFNRENMGNERLKKAFAIINRYKDKIYPPRYDIILDAPYETDEDRIENLRLIAEIPKPFRLQVFSLVLYPGTSLYNKAKADGLIKDEKREIYEKSYTRTKFSYLNMLISMAKGGRFPSPLLKFLTSSPTVNILNSKALNPLFVFSYKNLRRLLLLAKRLKRITGKDRRAVVFDRL